MWFTISKLVAPVLAPANLLLGLLVASAAWILWRPRSRAARRLAALAGAATVALAVLPIPDLLLRPLEGRFARPVPPPADVAGIVVLGGAVQPEMSAMRGEVALNRAAERMTEAVALSRRYPQARLVFTGANAALLGSANTEAAVARRFFAEMGVDSDRLVFEDRARNTYENALYTRDLVQPRAGETWLLVTSARHMPRAIGCFRRVGWQLVAWPVDYQTAPRLRFDPAIDPLANLQMLNDAAHEWAGMLAYWLIGYAAAPFPGP
jgi:uncharacterized SAM-binding protein YcdF (DUF218 family)